MVWKFFGWFECFVRIHRSNSNPMNRVSSLNTGLSYGLLHKLFDKCLLWLSLHLESAKEQLWIEVLRRQVQASQICYYRSKRVHHLLTAEVHAMLRKQFSQSKCQSSSSLVSKQLLKCHGPRALLRARVDRMNRNQHWRILCSRRLLRLCLSRHWIQSAYEISSFSNFNS